MSHVIQLVQLIVQLNYIIISCLYIYDLDASQNSSLLAPTFALCQRDKIHYRF
jgi:hypothetical protein